MGSYKELVQRIRWYAKALITGYAVVRTVAVACAISFVVAACSGGAPGASTSGTQSPAAATTVTSSGPPSSSPASASAPSSSAAEPAESATPGKNTPGDAVTGLIKGELADNWTLACSYIVPSTQPTCNQAAQEGKLPTFTGNATVDGDTISGSEALVTVIGSMCSSVTGCASNSVPSAGMPNSQVTFTRAYDQVLNNGSSSLSPVPCIEENGMWYINATL
jgi:hypothetical protein